MMVGINWTGALNAELVESLARSGKIDFVEIMVDNFLCCDPDSVKKVLQGLPCAFHIMNSQFLTADCRELQWCAGEINGLSNALSPMYISDHLGLFSDPEGRSFPAMMELDYSVEVVEIVAEKILSWSSLLGGNLLLENYASTLPSQIRQAQFVCEVLKKTRTSLLFDVSNALVAANNIADPLEDWLSLLDFTHHLHVGGYKATTFHPTFLVDDHTTALSAASLRTISEVTTLGDVHSICLEHDGDHSQQTWLSEIGAIRDACR